MAGRHLLVLTDFDGTLAELTPTPDQAEIARDVCRGLEALAQSSDVTIGVVSGRRREDVAHRVGPSAQFTAGLHGLEIAGPGVRFDHHALDSVRTVIANVRARAERALAWCPGVLLEDKTYALTCHVRRVVPQDAERALRDFIAVAEPELETHVLKLLTGTQARELLPAVDWHKGRAVDWIRSTLAAASGRATSVIYLGDDRTDEDAFAALGPDDVGIGVGPRPHGHLIRWRLAGPASVGRLLARLGQGR